MPPFHPLLSLFLKWAQSCVCQHSWFYGMPSGGNLSLFKHDFRCQSSPFKQHCRTKNSSRIKMAYPKLMILVSFYLKQNFLPKWNRTQWILSMILLKLWLAAVVFFLGHPVYQVQLFQNLTSSQVNEVVKDVFYNNLPFKAHLHWQKPKSKKPGFFCCTVYTARITHNIRGFWHEKRMREKNPNLILVFW